MFSSVGEDIIRRKSLEDQHQHQHTNTPTGTLGSSRSIEAKAGSSGYYAPEVARWLVSQKQEREIELSYEASQDAWSFGSVLFELCTGRNLFPLDLNDDSMVEEEDLTRLCSWSCLDNKSLDGVFKNCETCDPETRAQAQHLIRWCLQGDPSERPSFQKILEHPFLSQSLGVADNTEEDADSPTIDEGGVEPEVVEKSPEEIRAEQEKLFTQNDEGHDYSLDFLSINEDDPMYAVPEDDTADFVGIGSLGHIIRKCFKYSR